VIQKVGGWLPPVGVPIPSYVSWVTAADFNGDGKVDIVAAMQTANQVGVLFGNGDGTFQAAVTFPVGSGPNSVISADLNGDSKRDLVTTNADSNDVTVLLGRNGT